MKNNIMDQIGRLMGLRYKSHPWHGIDVGPDSPDIVMSFIEMVPTDTVKYEIDKDSGYLRIDRPQKFSNVIPALYGFIPQTYCAKNVAKLSQDALKRPDIIGDCDPLDICILTEKTISHGNIIVRARPLGGFRMIDGNEADDKIIAVLNNDAVYAQYNEISELPEMVVERLRHYFLTYKDMPGGGKRNAEITHTYGSKEAKIVIGEAVKDYNNKFQNLETIYGQG
ncbi:MAG: inorganic pyrophosphatase [Bacteroidales bacterium]|nr:inorganic pyrophosphatase [Bacteroidales bacterium]MCF8455610.1 inorganic pyrophosphatase [Bacteroidales bacterium]